MDCSTPGLPVYCQLLEFAQTHVLRVGDATQLSHPLSSPSPPPAFAFPALSWGQPFPQGALVAFIGEGVRHQDLGSGCAHCSWGLIVSADVADSPFS